MEWVFPKMPRKTRSSAAGKAEDKGEGKAKEAHGAKQQREEKASAKTPRGAVGRVAGARMGGVKHSGLLAKDEESRSVAKTYYKL